MIDAVNRLDPYAILFKVFSTKWPFWGHLEMVVYSRIWWKLLYTAAFNKIINNIKLKPAYII